MTNQYVILVDSRNSEKFRQFQNGQFNALTKEFLNKHSSNFIWGFHKSQISNQMWTKIKENDDIFFSMPKNNFKIAGRVKKKIIDYELGRAIFSDDLHSQEITHFILFDKLRSVDLLFHETMSKTKATAMFSGIYKLEKNVITNDISKKQNIPKLFIEEGKKKTGPTQRDLFEVMRFVRDSVKVKKLKELYQNKCQICEFTFEYTDGKFYSEVHHYNPLNAGADDDFDNMIVVCPNHHAKFDYNLIAIARDSKSIIDKNGNKIATIRFHVDHQLNINNIQSQLLN